VELRCRDLGRDYGRAIALDGISLLLTPGVTGLVGVNGAGKSTLLGTLAGAIRPSRGSVSLDGLDPYGSGRRPYLRQAALMPQSLELPGDARVADAVAYCGWLRGMSARDARKSARRVVAEVGLADRARDRIRCLSGGMTRRVALAQALVARPRLLLLDEPTTGLDPEQRAAVRTLIRAVADGGITIVSSHVMEDVESLADQIVVIDEGRVAHAGSLAQFRSEFGGGAQSAESAFLGLVARRRRR
jgi:ABC-2 type transport system ATP-binding protein